VFWIFAIKLGNFKVQTIISSTKNTQAYQQKMEKIFVLRRKSLVGLTPGAQYYLNIGFVSCFSTKLATVWVKQKIVRA
jgi:hypothetical protein